MYYKLHSTLKKLFTSISILIFLTSSYAQIPNSNLKLWVKADTGVVLQSGLVSEWQDMSGNNFHFTQSNPDFRPVLSTAGPINMPAIRFDGINDFLQVTFSQTFSLPNTFFVVWSYAPQIASNVYCYDGILPTNRNALFYNAAQGRINAFAGSSFNYLRSLPIYTVNSVIYLGNNQSRIFENGLQKVQGNSGVQSLTGLTLARGVDGGFMNGSIQELIFYDAALSDADRQQVEQYLMNKYAPPFSVADQILNDNFCNPITIEVDSLFTPILWSNGATTPTIQITDTGTYWVNVLDIFGQVRTDTFRVFLPPNLQQLAQTQLCPGGTATLNTGYPASGYSFLWNTGATTPSIQTNQLGLYSVQITDLAGGCSINVNINLTTDNNTYNPQIIAPTAPCVGNLLVVANNLGPVASYNWNTGSTQNSTVIQQGINSYNVNIVTNNGCVFNPSINIAQVGVAPSVDFEAVNNCANADVQFFNFSEAGTGTITSTNWTFGNGFTSTDANPTTIYIQSNNFNVKLVVQNSIGCIDSLVKTIFIKPSPQAKFSVADTCFGDSTRFINTGISSLPATYSWSFGSGGATSVLENPKFLYPNFGTYPVSLTVTNDSGCVNTFTRNIRIKPSPVADFQISNQCFGVPTVFNNLSSISGGAQISGFNWTFGDGGGSSLFSPQRLYTLPGQYTVSLTVFADNGCSHSITKDINVNRRLFANFVPEDTLCQRKQGRYFDQSTAINDTINQWRWRFSAEAIKFEKNPTHAFQGTGTRLVRLTVRSVGGCVDSIQKQVNIIASPLTNFEVEPQFGFPPFSPSITNLTVGGVVHIWDFGNGSTYSGFNPPNPTYSDTGSYAARLISLNDLGCSDTIFRQIDVYERFIAASIKSLLCVPDGNFMRMTAVLTNESPFPFKNIKLIGHLNGSSLTTETWKGELTGGQTLVYPFVAGVAIEGSPKYCCVKIVMVNDTLSLNQGITEICVPLVSEFTLTEPFPNPASNRLFLRFILPIEDEYTIEFFNITGHKLPLDMKAPGTIGFNEVNVDISTLSNGMYIVRLTYRGEQKTAKFVVNN